MSAEKVVMATTKRINGIRITREALVEAAEKINGDKAIRQGTEHDDHYAPIGKVRWASVIDLDEESALVVLPDDTHVFTDRIHEPTGIRIVEVTFPNDTRPFVIHEERIFESALTVRVDWTNFDDKENFDKFCETTDEDGDSVVSPPMVRRSLVPDPLIQFAVNYPEIAMALTWVLWRGEKFLRYTVDQTLRKTGDVISERVSEKIKEWIGVYNKTRAPHEQPVTSHMIIKSDPQIHLLTRSQDPEHNTEIGIESLAKQLELYQDLVKDADSVTFARKTRKEEWAFLYATTKSGKIITTERCYLDTLKKREEIAKTFPICICMEHKETKEERHYETTVVIVSLSDDGEMQLKFNSFPADIDEWEITQMSLLTRKDVDSQTRMP